MRAVRRVSVDIYFVPGSSLIAENLTVLSGEAGSDVEYAMAAVGVGGRVKGRGEL